MWDLWRTLFLWNSSLWDFRKLELCFSWEFSLMNDSPNKCLPGFPNGNSGSEVPQRPCLVHVPYEIWRVLQCSSRRGVLWAMVWRARTGTLHVKTLSLQLHEGPLTSTQIVLKWKKDKAKWFIGGFVGCVLCTVKNCKVFIRLVSYCRRLTLSMLRSKQMWIWDRVVFQGCCAQHHARMWKSSSRILIILVAFRRNGDDW